MHILRKSKAMLELIRPELPISAGVCVVVGQVIALARFSSVSSMALGFGLGFFLSASAMIFNDYFDLEVDRINSPQRPLPSGLLSTSEVIILGGLTAVIAWGLAMAIHPAVFALSLVLWLLGFLYNWKFKAAGIVGNLIVSLNVAMTFILGGISVGMAASPLVWIFGLIAFVFDLGEEIAGDAMDMEGDQKRGSKSLAIVYGKQTALRIAGLLFLGMVALTFLPLSAGETRLEYILPIMLIDAYILIFTARLLKSKTPREGRGAMRSLYLGASFGLIVFIVVRFLR